MPFVEICIIFLQLPGYYFPTPAEFEPMTCLECEKELSYMDHRKSMEMFQAELCPYHRKRLERLLAKSELPVEAVILYYGLRQEWIRPMLAWWDGKKTVDLAISRIQLNIEIDRGYESLSHQQAMQELESNLFDFRNGFTHIRIPSHLIRSHVGETVEILLRVMEGLREKSRVV